MSTAGSDDIYGESSTFYDFYVGDWLERTCRSISNTPGASRPPSLR